MSYWDTSALLKLYLTEHDSASFQSLLSPSSRFVTSFIGKHEARTAFRRREAEGAVGQGGAAACYGRLLFDISDGWLTLVPDTLILERAFGQVLEQCLSEAPPIFVRTNDGLHLAAARIAGETDFVSADHKQRIAAEFLGFNVLPAVHPIPVPLP